MKNWWIGRVSKGTLLATARSSTSTIFGWGRVIVTASTLLATNQALGQTETGMTPPVGVETSATIGSAVVEKFQYKILEVTVADTDVVRGTITGKIKIAAGEPLTPVSSNAKFKACSSHGPCGLDDDGDGTFDRIALDDVATALSLKAPVAYHRKEIIAPSEASNFKQIVSYLGISGDTLRLSYREFMNDMARPAFTEELTIPMSKTFPQPIAFKDVRTTILQVTGMGLRYRLER